MPTLRDTRLPLQLIGELVSPAPSARSSLALNARKLAECLDWRPTYVLADAPYVDKTVTCHIAVEHGVETPALITIATHEPSTSSAEWTRRRLLEISFNQLIDWHLIVTPREVSLLASRLRDPLRDKFLLDENTAARLGRDHIRELGDEEPAWDYKAVDDYVVGALSRWQGILFEQVEGSPSERLRRIATLFNSLILARALEDHGRVRGVERGRLMELVADTGNAVAALRSLSSEMGQGVGHLVTEAEEEEVGVVAPDLVRDLLRDLYAEASVPFDYDFALMSKHALSRIYERYVTRLKSDPRNEELLFNVHPPKGAPKAQEGAVYTPPYIASFITEFIIRQVPPSLRREVVVADFACGSGIFLRTHLEHLLASGQYGQEDDFVSECASRLVGIDVDENAVRATRLSLSLLFYAATHRIPELSEVRVGDSLELYLRDALPAADVILGNPPFISYEGLDSDGRAQLQEVLGDAAVGRLDKYLAFLQVALRRCKEGGYIGLVVPSSFLRGTNASALRKVIASDFHVLCIADLSDVSLFERVSVYAAILILKRRHGADLPGETLQKAVVVKAASDPEDALQAVLDRRETITRSWRVYGVHQEAFAEDAWSLHPPEVFSVVQSLAAHPRLGEVVDIRQGIRTGLDKAFIVEESEVPKQERKAYRALLDDRDIGRYGLRKPRMLLWYDPVANIKSEEDFRERFPWTFDRLSQLKEDLKGRSAVRRDKRTWYSLHWPRYPEILHPKLVCPEFAVTPRFAVDTEGAVLCKTTYLQTRQQTGDAGLLLWLSAVLNSSVVRWWLAVTATRIRGGYSRLDVKQLRSVPIPQLSELATPAGRETVELVRDLLSHKREDQDLEGQIERLVLQSYHLSADDQDTVLGRTNS